MKKSKIRAGGLSREDRREVVNAQESELKKSFKKHVLAIVAQHTFVKATVLPTLIDQQYFTNPKMDAEDITKWTQELVASGHMNEIEYLAEEGSKRLKSCYVDRRIEIQKVIGIDLDAVESE